MAYASITQMREYLPQIPEWGQQLITANGASSGTFTLIYENVETSSIAYDSTATQLQTILRAITAIGSGGVKINSKKGGPWRAMFQGDLAENASPLTIGQNNLTGISPSISIAPYYDSQLQRQLDRATDIVRNAIRYLIDDQSFDYTMWGIATTKNVYGIASEYLSLPPHLSGSITLVEYQSSVGVFYPVTGWYESDGRLFLNWNGQRILYRITAVWGYGPIIPAAIEEVVLEIAVNLWRSKDRGGFTEIIGVEGSGYLKSIAGLTKQQTAIIESIVSSYQPIGV
jgi:hypothetical protein